MPSPHRQHRPTTLAQSLHRAILRTGTSLLRKSQIRHLRAFRIAVLKDGPDLILFSNPGALVKLALWVGEAVRAQEGRGGSREKGTPLVLAGLVEERGIYVVVGLGGGGGVGSHDPTLAQKRREREAAEQIIF